MNRRTPAARARIEHSSRSLHVHGRKGGGSPFDNDADEVHCCVCSVEQARERGVIIKGAGHEVGSLGREETRPGQVPDQSTDAVAAAEQEGGDVAADESGGPGDGN